MDCSESATSRAKGVFSRLIFHDTYYRDARGRLRSRLSKVKIDRLDHRRALTMMSCPDNCDLDSPSKEQLLPSGAGVYPFEEDQRHWTAS